MKNTFFVFLISSLLTLLASLAFAVPVEISYQGYLTDTVGVPVNGTTNITFKLYDNLDAVQWDSGTVAVDVANGVYSVILGASPQPVIDPVIFSQDLRLGVTVEGDAEMTPKQKLTSVGFSIRALTADSVADGAVTNATITGPISSTKIEQGPGSTLDADTVDGKQATDLQDRVTGACGPGSSMTTVNADGSVVCTPTGLTGTLTNNYVPRSDGTGLVDSTIFDNGKVGIGTSAPTAKLDVFTSPLDSYGPWLNYDAYYNPCEHCSDTCDGNTTAEFACSSDQLSCEDIRNSDGEYWEYRTVSCNQVQTAAHFSGDVNVSGGSLNGDGSGLTNVNAELLDSRHASDLVDLNNPQTITGLKTFNATGTVPFVVDGRNNSAVTNLNADLLDGQHSSEIIAAASDEVRTPISSCGVTISTPGSYYVTRNLSTTGTCITVTSDNVTIDLMGFILTGDNSGTNEYGIYVQSLSNVAVRNGTVRDFTTGIYGSSSEHMRVINVQALGNTQTGISTGMHSHVKGCSASANGWNGIFAPTSIVDSNIVFDNGQSGIASAGSSILTNNHAYNNGQHGLAAGDGSTVTNNIAIYNQCNGIYLNNYSLVTNNTATNNNLGNSGCYNIYTGNPTNVFGINVAP